MEERPQLMGGFPRPGPALKAVLIVVAACSVIGAILGWVPRGGAIISALVFSTERVLQHGEVWRLLTSGVITVGLGHVFFTLIGLLFLSPDLERRWGAWRFVRFLAIAVITGNLLAMAVDVVAGNVPIFHHMPILGGGAAITAVAVAWSNINADRQVRLFFVLPVSGRQLLWVTIGFCFLSLLYAEPPIEGVVAPFGGVVVGLLLGGTPSALRSVYLRMKLSLLRSKAAGPSRSVPPRPPRRPGRGSGPPLRVVYGGLEDELKKRKPPKDKRYLN